MKRLCFVFVVGFFFGRTAFATGCGAGPRLAAIVGRYAAASARRSPGHEAGGLHVPVSLAGCGVPTSVCGA